MFVCAVAQVILEKFFFSYFPMYYIHYIYRYIYKRLSLICWIGEKLNFKNKKCKKKKKIAECRSGEI